MLLKLLAGAALALGPLGAQSQPATAWVTTTAAAPWRPQPAPRATAARGPADAEIDLTHPAQTITGFGACFNELGWTSLALLPAAPREGVFRELFAPGVGANFTICRMPVGANDFSRDWYSYDETPGDFSMANFSIANDRETLIPFIKQAQRQYPALRLWASPWSPPTWMKTNHHYAAAAMRPEYRQRFPDLADNGLPVERQGKEGHNLFIQDDKYFTAYALYFRKFIEAYQAEGISIGMVMPQNEFNSAQVFPSCPWTATGLARFIGCLGPQLAPSKTDIYFGTMERPNEALVDTVLRDPRSAPYVHGVGFQWAGKAAIAGIHRRYPALALYQSEQECGDGQNDWKYCRYTWDLMKQYLGNGANAYLYWNISLKQGGLSRWGWRQNSLVAVDEAAHTYKWTHEYYLMKHLSHYVRPGARRLPARGPYANLLAFQNPDRSIVVIIQNPDAAARTVAIRVGARTFAPQLPADSFSTLVLR